MSQTIHSIKVKVGSLIAAQKEVGKLRREMQKLDKKDPKFAQKQSALQGQIDATNQKFKQQVKNIKGVENQTKKLTTTAGRMINTFKSAAIAIASAFAVRAIVGSIKGVIQVMADFEAKMAAVRAISGATNEEFKKLEKSALDFGSSTVFTARQVAELQEEYARLGFSTEEIIAASDATLSLAAATGESLANSAKTAGSVLRAFGYEATQTGRIADVMAQSFTNSALNLERFTESMKFAAPVAQSVGFTVEETTTMLMKLADAGLHGSIAGNALKKIFLELGNSGSKLSKKLGGPVQGIEQLDEALLKINESGMNAGDVVELLGARAAPAFLALMESAGGLGEVNEMLNMTEGAVSEMALIRLDTLQGDITLMKSALEGLGLALGDSINLQLRQVIYRFTNWIRSITESEEKLKRFRQALKAIGLAIVFITTRLAAIGIINFGRTLIFTTIPTLWKMVTAFYAAATGASTFSVALASTGVGAIIVAVGTLVGLLTTLFVGMSDFGGAVDETTMKIDRQVSAIERQIQAILDADEATSERAKLLRKLKQEAGQFFEGVDLELADDEDLINLQANIKSLNREFTELEKYEETLINVLSIEKATNRMLGEAEEMLGRVSGQFNTLNASDLSTLDMSTKKLTLWSAALKEVIMKEKDWSEEDWLDAAVNKRMELGDLRFDPIEGWIANKMDSDFQVLRFFATEVEEILGGMGKSIMVDKEVGDIIHEIRNLEVSDGAGGTRQPFMDTYFFGEDKDDTFAGLVNKVTQIYDRIEKTIKSKQNRLTDDLLNDPSLKDLKVDEGDDPLRLELREGYTKDLERFRGMSEEVQNGFVAKMEEELRLLNAAEEIARTKDPIEKGFLLEAVGDENDQKKVLKMVDDFQNELYVRSTEMERFVSAIKQNHMRNVDPLEEVVTVQLQNTKNHFKKLKKLTAKFHADEWKAKIESAKAKYEIEQEAHQNELDLMRRNLKDLAAVRGDEDTAGASTFALSQFIEKNKAKYQAIKELDAQAYIDATSGLEAHRDSMLAIIDNMIAEEQTKEQNNVAYLKKIKEQWEREEEDLLMKRRHNYQETARDLADIEMEMSIGSTILNKRYKEQRKLAEDNMNERAKEIKENAEKTVTRIETENKEVVEALKKTWDEKIEAVKKKQRELSQAEFEDAKIDLGSQMTEELAEHDAEKPDAEEDPQAFEAWGAKRLEIEAKWNNLIEGERDAHLTRLENINAGHNDAVIAEVEKKNKAVGEKEDEGAKAVTKINNERDKDLMQNQMDFDDWSLQSTEEQMQGIIDTYAQAFSALSALWDNRIAMERKFLEENFSTRMEDLDRQAEAEIESFEGNSEQQEIARKKWEKRKELEQEHQDMKLRALDEKKFKREKANNIAMALMNGALAVAKVWGETGPFGFALAPIVAGLVAAQVGLIMAQEFVGQYGGLIPEFGAGGMVHGPSHSKGGVKFGVGGRVVELEGGEAVINKKSTAMFRPQLSAMNVAGGGVKFADGGITPSVNPVMNKNDNSSEQFAMVAQRIIDGINDKEVFVTESSVTETQNSISVTESNAVLF